MPKNLTNFHNFDPDFDYEIDDIPEDFPEAVACCQCVVNENQLLCHSEDAFGTSVTSAAARAFVYWGNW